MGNILNRIQEIAVNERISIGALERKIGASKGVLSRAINNGTDIQAKWLQQIVENYPQYSAEWLLTGMGPMFRENNKSSLEIINSINMSVIPMVDISVAAGCSGYDNPNFIEVVDSIKLPASMIKHNAKYFCIRVKGESMSPTLLDSSYVVVRLLEKQEWADIPDQHVYVISDREGRAYIKRIKNRLQEKGIIVCMSDNPDKTTYPNFNLQQDEIHTILHAEWYISAKMPNIHDTYYKKVSEMEDNIDLLQSQMNQVLKIINIKK